MGDSTWRGGGRGGFDMIMIATGASEQEGGRLGEGSVGWAAYAYQWQGKVSTRDTAAQDPVALLNFCTRTAQLSRRNNRIILFDLLPTYVNSTRHVQANKTDQFYMSRY